MKQAIDLETGADFTLEQGLGIFSGFWGIEASHVCDELAFPMMLIIYFWAGRLLLSSTVSLSNVGHISWK